MHRKRGSRTLLPLDFSRSSVIARALSVIAWIGLASLAHADTLYTDKTDRELTQLAAGWESLSEDQRRALLTEIKARMHASGDKTPVLTIRTERRYGRIVRKPDGSLVRVETTAHIVRYQRLPQDAGDRPFGLGFEQRAGTDAAQATGQTPVAQTPAMRAPTTQTPAAETPVALTPPAQTTPVLHTPATPHSAPPVPVMQVGTQPH